MSCYATLPDDFYAHGLRAAALPASITTAEIIAQVTSSSGVADSYMGSRFRLPISAWGVDLTAAVCKHAAFELVASQVGFNPEAGHNMVLLDRKTDAIRWFEQIAAGKVTPTGIVDSTPSAGPGGPSSAARAFSKRRRGW